MKPQFGKSEKLTKKNGTTIMKLDINNRNTKTIRKIRESNTKIAQKIPIITNSDISRQTETTRKGRTRATKAAITVVYLEMY